MQPAHMAYDRAITVFSPDGRLFQVEYAREAVKRGTTTVGVKFKDGVVLIVDKRIASKLIEPRSIEKIFQIDRHIGCATSGLVADARVLVDRARIEAQMAMVTYNERISVEALVKSICDFKQTYTQYGGVRPFGTALLIAGVDPDGPGLYETDPSGALMAYNAGSIGRGREAANEVLEQNYRKDLSMAAAINLGIQALYEATEGELNAGAIEMGSVKMGGNFERLDAKTVKKHVSRAMEKLPKDNFQKD